MSKRIAMLLVGVSLCLFFAVPDSVSAKELQLVFIEPDVSKRMHDLSWEIPELKKWRRMPIKRVNNDSDGMFNLKVKVLNISDELINTTPRLKICPMPNRPDECWEQEVLTPVNERGIFKCRVYFRLSNWDTHTLKFKLGKEIIKVIINEEPF